MGVLADLGRGIAGVTGAVLSDYALGDEFYKAGNEDDDGGGPSEGADRTPGGKKEDTAENSPPPTEPATEDPQTLFWDPYAIVEQLGYKEKASSISYGTLRSMVWKTPIIQAILQTRISQIAAFAQPVRSRYDMGFRLKLRDAEETPSPADKKWIKQVEPLILRTIAD